MLMFNIFVIHRVAPEQAKKVEALVWRSTKQDKKRYLSFAVTVIPEEGFGGSTEKGQTTTVKVPGSIFV